MQGGLQRHLQGTPFNAFAGQPSPFPDPARASFLSAVKLQEQPFAYGQPRLASKAPAFLFPSASVVANPQEIFSPDSCICFLLSKRHGLACALGMLALFIC
jgi:hypothetical protein